MKKQCCGKREKLNALAMLLNLFVRTKNDE